MACSATLSRNETNIPRPCHRQIQGDRRVTDRPMSWVPCIRQGPPWQLRSIAARRDALSFGFDSNYDSARRNLASLLAIHPSAAVT